MSFHSHAVCGCSHQYNFKIVVFVRGVSKGYKLQINSQLDTFFLFTQLKGIKKDGVESFQRPPLGSVQLYEHNLNSRMI